MSWKIAEGKDYVTLMTCTPYGITPTACWYAVAA